jgi:hypothetical protein
LATIVTITYAKFAPRFYCESDALERSVLFFDPVRERNEVLTVGDRYRILDESVRANDVVILRGRTQRFLDTLEREKDSLKRLAGGAPIAALVGSLARGAPPSLIPISGELVLAPESVTVLRQVELEAILRRSGAIFDDNTYHYILPSGCHANSFIRVADALQDPIDVLRIVDWVLPYVGEKTVVVADTGSLLPLLFALRLEAQRLFGWDLSVRTIAEYPELDTAIEEVLLEINAKLSAGHPLLFLVSVNSSGRLVRRMQSLAPKGTPIVVVTSTSPELANDAVLDLSSIPVDKWAPREDGQCDHCGDGFPLGIDGRTYERLPQPKLKLFKVSWDKASSAREFWEAAAATDAIKLHYDAEYPEDYASASRHHSVYVDLLRLLESGWFIDTVRAEMGALLVPDVVLIPKHRCSEALATLAHAAFPRASTEVIPPGRFVEAAERSLLPQGALPNVLILDDALVGGRTLKGMRDEVYRITQSRGTLPVQGFVLLARPHNDSVLQATRRRFTDKDKGPQFRAGYQIYLPPSGNEHCPWCAEFKAVSAMLLKLDATAREFAEVRRRKLASELQHPFILGTEPLPADLTTSGAFFGNLDPLTGFAAAVSAAQQLRNEMKTGASGPVVSVIDVAMLIDAYFDTVFLAALLRTFERRELVHASQYENVSAALQRQTKYRDYPGTTAELVWAATNAKLPMPAICRVLGALDATPEIQYLQALLALTQRDDTRL